MFSKNTSDDSSQHGVNCVTVQNDYNHHRLSPAGNIIVSDIPISTELCLPDIFGQKAMPLCLLSFILKPGKAKRGLVERSLPPWKCPLISR